MDPLPNHKLFRIDNIYLYPYVKEQIYFKFIEECNNTMFNKKYNLNNTYTTNKIISLSYCYGIFLKASKQICYGLKCYLQKSTVNSFCTY